MIGFSVWSGNVVMASTLLLTSSTTRRASAPRSSSIITEPIPSDAVDWMRLMPSMPWIASSIRTFTPSSTSSGAAPRYGTSTWMRSSSISGNASSRVLVAPRRPLTTMNAIVRLAATLLRANQSIMACTLPLDAPRGLGRSFAALAAFGNRPNFPGIGRPLPASGASSRSRAIAGLLSYLRVSSRRPGLSARMRVWHHVNVSRAALTASATVSIAGASASPVMNS